VSERATSADVLKTPFPYTGGKARVADLVWERLGNVDNFVEPFAGSLAVLLRRPANHFADGYRVETCNDLNHYIVNFWRAIKAAPEKVAEYADSPVLEADLHARHKWLVRSKESVEWREQMRTDPEAYDAKIAGWWCWGACCWIGGAWCAHKVDQNVMPLLDPSQKGVCSGWNENPTDWEQVPRISDAGSGVTANAPLGTCDARRVWLVGWFRRLADRLRLVRTCYGHWSRICDSDSTLTRLGTTGVFLDPPYPAMSTNGKKSRDPNLYATDKGADLNELRDEVLAWCRKWGADRQIRVAVCGYEGDGYEPLEGEGWAMQAWEANGGYANQRRKGKGKADNAKRERIWFSPHCAEADLGLFAEAA
jgi:DNA adenine methylase